MSESLDPWEDLEPQNQSEAHTRRVDPQLRWNHFWGLDWNGSCLLILKHARANRPGNRMPRLSGLGIEIRGTDDPEQLLLVLRLREKEHRNLFHRLCSDVVDATRQARSEEEAVALFVARTLRWHRLLRSGGLERLSPEEQKGLIGELRFLLEYLFPVLGPGDALLSWTGPFDAPKDFEIGTVCVESKARRGASKPFLSISGEHQLDDAGLSAFYLHVCDVSKAVGSDEQGRTLDEIVQRVRQRVESDDVGALQLWEERLSAAGFDRSHDYSQERWLIGVDRFYEVDGDFPRITADELMGGVANVNYKIDVHACDPWRVDPEQIQARIRGE